jgi:hypothetical protein
VGLIAAELERQAIVTVAVSVMPEITRAVGVPRTLVVPFGLGRPFGAPNDRDAQLCVIRAMLALASRADVPVVESL